jgi:hypothetical protein
MSGKLKKITDFAVTTKAAIEFLISRAGDSSGLYSNQSSCFLWTISTVCVTLKKIQNFLRRPVVLRNFIKKAVRAAMNVS